MPTEEIWVELSEFDRLSDLPDDLLLHIMCFLPTRLAVNTCILSKRWRNLWRYLPCLHFDAYHDDNFVQFITSFFNLRSNCHIDTFQLHGLAMNHCWLATRPLVTQVLESRPRVLSIKSGVSSWGQLDFDSVFTCASVEKMELVEVFFPRKSPITLFNLKRLNLTRTELDGECVNNLISGCPVLEELVMNYCSFWFPNVTIVSHSLKKLSIDGCEYYDNVQIHLSVPSLVSLHVTQVMLGRIWLKNMSSLVKVHIQFCFSVCIHYLNSRNELLRGLSNAKYIELTGPGVRLSTESPVKDLLVKELPTCRVFANLKSLYLGKCSMCGFLSPISHLEGY
ncbi:FBD-associated F-box protein [Rhynchospora pubera]|uniref:FBD-associated F-box protein n=1 Tax=Rhynchospora pubera TaxID=906938 RepID=A0AAV8EYH3_9POAL|nr:FBD-associated F-box protein [Rhynchospora pubera]